MIDPKCINGPKQQKAKVNLNEDKFRNRNPKIHTEEVYH